MGPSAVRVEWELREALPTPAVSKIGNVLRDAAVRVADPLENLTLPPHPIVPCRTSSEYFRWGSGIFVTLSAELV